MDYVKCLGDSIMIDGIHFLIHGRAISKIEQLSIEHFYNTGEIDMSVWQYNKENDCYEPITEKA